MGFGSWVSRCAYRKPPEKAIQTSAIHKTGRRFVGYFINWVFECLNTESLLNKTQSKDPKDIEERCAFPGISRNLVLSLELPR